MKLQHLLPVLLVLTLAACGGGGNDAPVGKDAAVIATRAPDYSSGAVSLAELVAPFTAQNELNGTTSDIFVRSGGDHYFLVERFMSNKVKRYAAASPTTQVYSYSTQDVGDTVDSNPSDLIIVSPTKAYLLRYGSGKLWIVNPSANTEAGFKTGEIDLSAYDADGVPEMTAGLIRNGRLYVAMQRLDNFAALKSGYVAVIDVATDLEIDTGAGAPLKGVELEVRNPVGLVADPGSNDLLVVADGGFDNFVPTYAGGIVRLNTTTFATTLLLDDGTADAHPRGQIFGLALASGTRGYFYAGDAFTTNQTLYRFNPTTADAPIAVAGHSGVGIGTIAIAPDGNLWLTRVEDAAPGVSILGFAAGTETVVMDLIGTTLIPLNFDFVVVPPTP